MDTGKPRKAQQRRRAVPPSVTGTNGAAEHEALPDGPVEAGTGCREELIRRAAYALAEQRGFQAGRELDDWLEAEAVVDGQFARRSEP